MKTPPPRLHVIPATGCDTALVLRRGSSGQVASLLWDRAQGSFEMGQWLKGRIYEHRSDLSPDGRHMVYFAGNGRRWWTALSRAPYLRAIACYPQDSTWHGGGAFTRDGRLWFNGARPEEQLPDGLKAAAAASFPHGTDGFHMGDLFPAMMTQRGWEHVSGTAHDSVLRKALSGDWALELSFRLWGRNRSLISNAYSLVRDAGQTRIAQPDWEWAEPFGDVIQFAARGALFQARLSPRGQPEDVCLIRIFADMTFEALKAPYAGVTAG
jgi:hypothetical protein